MKSPLRLFAAGAESQIRCNTANRAWYGSKSLQLQPRPIKRRRAKLGAAVRRRGRPITRGSG
jgi:hypothetical protein